MLTDWLAFFVRLLPQAWVWHQSAASFDPQRGRCINWSPVLRAEVESLRDLTSLRCMATVGSEETEHV